MLKAYKYRIYPNKQQEELIAKTFGCCRFIYNWALSLKMEAYQKDKTSISVFTIDAKIKDLKKSEETIWLNEVNSQSLQDSLKRLDSAYTGFFRDKKGFPKFKSKHDKQSFSNPQNTKVDFDKKLVYVPKFRDGIKCKFHRTFEGDIKISTVSKTPTGKYFISILVDDRKNLPVLKNPKENETLGIDLGIKDFAIFSDGNKIANPKYLNKKLKQLKRQQKKLSRKQKGSNNRNKQRQKVAKIHEKVANSRKDFIHKTTHDLVENQNYSSYAIEDLSVQDMIKNGNKSLSRNIGDAGWYMFRQLLKYKCDWKGKNLLVIGRFEPSSRLCSCGYYNKELSLKDRSWTCPDCKTKHDRDILAANNIKKFAFCKQNTKKVPKDKKIKIIKKIK